MTTPRPGVVDLRQYTLVPGRRDELIELFDRHFVDGQETVGIQVIGQFRDLDDPDRFVWLRGFESMAARGEALDRFYGGPVWQRHRDRANRTMVDSDDALLLEPTWQRPGSPPPRDDDADPPDPGLVAITVAYLTGPVAEADRELSRAAGAEFVASGAELVATFATHDAENNFPALPLRDEHVLVWVSRFADDAAHGRSSAALDASPHWAELRRRLAARCSRLPMQHLRLRPTERSALR